MLTLKGTSFASAAHETRAIISIYKTITTFNKFEKYCNNNWVTLKVPGARGAQKKWTRKSLRYRKIYVTYITVNFTSRIFFLRVKRQARAKQSWRQAHEDVGGGEVRTPPVGGCGRFVRSTRKLTSSRASPFFLIFS